MPDRKTAAIICHARFLDLAAFGETLDQKTIGSDTTMRAKKPFRLTPIPTC